MTFRMRLLIAFALATILPLTLLALGVRAQITSRILAEHRRRVEAVANVARQDFEREKALVAARLSTLARDLRTDDDFRLAVLGDRAKRAYLLDWGEQAMRASALDMLQLQDSAGRILSSGHFRNEFDRLDTALPRALTEANDAVLVPVRAPEGPFFALAQVDSVIVADRRFNLVAGVRVDSAFLQRFVRDEGLAATIVRGDSAILRRSARDDMRAPNGGTVAEILLHSMVSADSAGLTPARLAVWSTVPELALLQSDVDRWFTAALVLVVVGALALAAWLSRRLSEPLATLTHAASTIDLEGPELALAAGRDDEIGMLARRLGSLSTRLRASAARLRQAERRATVGDMARQVNHDIKNGLIPIRNVLRHLVQVQEQRPQDLATVFAERWSTLESSVGYLDTLARNYARLTPSVERRAVDVNAIAAEVASSTAVASTVKIRTRLADSLPRALGDPVVVRRIIDNLVRNAVESLEGNAGEVTVATAPAPNGAVRIMVVDTGRGMSEQELAHAFDDFYTTKAEGTGLGLSVVRRLTTDLNGSVRVESAPGQGTAFTIELPSCTPS